MICGQLLLPNVVRFAGRLDALLNLLDATADALAATWDLQQEGTIDENVHKGDGFKSTIH